jgi:cytochrome c oxidase subunit IV
MEAAMISYRIKIYAAIVGFVAVIGTLCYLIESVGL